MEDDKKQIHLGYGVPPKAADADGKPVAQKPRAKMAGFSGRGVRFRMLTADEAAHIKEQYAKEITPETTNVEYDAKVADAGLDKMILAYTEPVTPEKLPEAKWIVANYDTLSTSKATLFTAKDVDLLKTVYLMHHRVSTKELEDIMGGIVGFVD
jgi:hypothetical protein